MHAWRFHIHTFGDPIRSIRLLMIIACMLPYCLLQREEGIIVTKETTAAVETRPQPVSMNDSYVNDDAVDSDSSMDDDDDEEELDDDEEEGDVRGGGGNSKMQYEIQFQRQQHPQQNQSGGGVRPNASASAGAGPAATASGSFLTMVHH
jgi:hypothetical protein